MEINCFDGEYTFLSNFFPCVIKFDNNNYPSVEHAFQAAKTRDRKEQFKVWQAVHQKFQNENLRKLLLATGDAELIEGNYWHDYYWGICNGVGQNWLGKILMEEREKIKNGN